MNNNGYNRNNLQGNQGRGANPPPRQGAPARPQTQGSVARPVAQGVARPQSAPRNAAGGVARPASAGQVRQASAAAQRRPVQRPAEQRAPQGSSGAVNQAPRRRALQNSSDTRSIDRKNIKMAQKSREAKLRYERDDEEEEEEGGGSGAVMSLIKAILYIVVVVAVSALISYYVIVFANDMYAFVKNSEEVEVSIPEYATVEEIADILGDAGVVKYPDLLVIYAKLKKIDKTYEFVAGDYTVNGMMNYDELFYAFVPHKSYEIVRITIPEGYTVDEIINLFTENGIGTREGFIEAINNYDFDFDFVRALDEADLTGRTYRLEGYLYPDTYEFYKSSSEVTVIYKMLNRFDVIFSEDFYEKAAEHGYSVDAWRLRIHPVHCRRSAGRQDHVHSDPW